MRDHRSHRRFTTAYKLEVLRKADACTRPGELGALLRTEGLYALAIDPIVALRAE